MPGFHSIKTGVPRIQLAAAMLAVIWLSGLVGYPNVLAANTVCESVSADYPDGMGGGAVHITKVKNITCKEARSVMYKCIRYPTVKGWKVGGPSDPGQTKYLRKGSQWIYFYVFAGGGTSCAGT